MSAYERFVCIPDVHGEEVDERAFGCAVNFCKVYRPHVVFILGDFVDFPTVSKFPRSPEGGQKLQMELDTCKDLLKRIRVANSKAKIYYIRGNHEYRLDKYLWTRAAELWPLKCLRVPELLDFKEYGIQYVEEGRIRYRNVMIIHGDKVAQKSGYTAHRELQDHWMSGISGHTHRLAVVSHTSASGRYQWIESGCLCKLNPDYAEGKTFNWQQGLSWGEFTEKGERFKAQAEQILNGKLRWQGQDITWEGTGSLGKTLKHLAGLRE